MRAEFYTLVSSESECGRNFLVERLILLRGLNIRVLIALKRLLFLHNPHFVAIVVV